VAAYLAFRLAKLDAMRRAYEGFEARAVLGRDVFTRGDPQATVVVSHDRLEGDIHELMDAYVSQRRRADDRRYAPRPATCYRLDDARHHLNDILPELGDWTPLAKVTLRPGGQGDEPSAASFLASTLSATLEMVREGALETRQLKPFSDVYLRAVAA